MERRTPDDRLVLWSDARWPQDIAALAILDGRALLGPGDRLRIDAVREWTERRLRLLPRFRQIIFEPGWGRGGPVWVDSADFDLTQHVRVADVPEPGGEEQLLVAIERLRVHPLDRSRPLWEIWLLHGLPDARIGLLIRLHHVVADGVAAVASLASLLDSQPDASTSSAPPWTPAPVPTQRALIGDSLRRAGEGLGRARRVITHPTAAWRRARAAAGALRELLADEPGPQTSLNRLVGPGRTFALIRSSLEPVAAVGHKHGATVNDVLLAATARGIRELLRSRKEAVDGLSLPIYVPISLRRDRAGVDAGNLISQMVIRLPVGIADSGHRLLTIAAQTASRKGATRPALGSMFRSRSLARMMLPLVARQRVNVESADVRGPSAPLYFCGAPVLEVFPLVNLIGTVSLGVAALSYAGQLNIMAVADADAYPDLDVLAAGIRVELSALTGA